MRAHRIDRVAATIRNVVGNVIAHRLNDPRITSIISVTRVEISGDLMHAKVYVSVMGNEVEQRRTMSGLDHSVRFVQSCLARELTTRHCPRLTFVLDTSTQKALETIRLIDETMAEYEDQADSPEADPDDGESESQGDGE